MFGTYVEVDVIDSEGFDRGFKAVGDAAVVLVATRNEGSVIEFATPSFLHARKRNSRQLGRHKNLFPRNPTIPHGLSNRLLIPISVRRIDVPVSDL
jgi:hypothetical protein